MSNKDSTVKDDSTDADGNSVLRYGEAATAVGEPDKVFGMIRDQFLLIPENVLGWSIIEENEQSPGIVDLAALSGPARGMLSDKLVRVELAELVAQLQEYTSLGDEKAAVLLLSSGFELSTDEIADRLDISPDAVREYELELSEQYDIDRVVTELSQHLELTEQQARIAVLSQGVGYSDAQIADELGITEETVRDTLSLIAEEYDAAIELP